MKTQTQSQTQISHVAIFLMLAVLSGCATQSTNYLPEDVAGVPKIPGINIITSPDSSITEARATTTLHLPESDALPAGTDIVIRPGKDHVLHEYYLNGNLFSIKVIPAVGSPYYLVAVDTTGNFIHANRPQMLIPSWKVKEF